MLNDYAAWSIQGVFARFFHVCVEGPGLALGLLKFADDPH
jgi:hypothetical protein